MTREEAIRELKQFSGTTRLRLSANFWTAHNMAIKSLEQMPSEDCVSRQAVLERINDWWGITSTSGEPSICDYIRELPSVTSTRKKGKWLSAEEYALKIGAEVTEDIKNSLYKFCPFCEQTVFMERNYCPNCGAEMVGAENE